MAHEKWRKIITGAPRLVCTKGTTHEQVGNLGDGEGAEVE